MKLRTKTCYRTYRNRGWCVLEMMCSMLSREKTHPALLITSAQGTPEWVSSLETLKVAVGLCDFTCCQRNHTFPGIGVVPCDRDITRGILETLINSKVKHLFDSIRDMMHARLYSCLSTWWTRTFKKRMPFSRGVKDLKRLLRWTDDLQTVSSIFDANNISMLLYVCFCISFSLSSFFLFILNTLTHTHTHTHTRTVMQS